MVETEAKGFVLLRAAWFALGACALALGALGVVLPVLPTTPFVILAAFAFGKSAPALQARLEQSRVFGPMILDWRSSGAISPRVKVISLTMMGGVFCASIAMSVTTLVLTVQAVCITAAGAFILTRPNRAP